MSAAFVLALALGLRLGHRADRPREGVWFDRRTKQREVFMARRQRAFWLYHEARESLSDGCSNVTYFTKFGSN